MKPLAHLLAATDLSATSLHAVDRGFLIAKETGARLTVIHALGLTALAPLRELLAQKVSTLTEQVTHEARDVLQRVMADPARNQGVSAELELAQGLAISVIPDHAARTQADLILLGAHGKGFLQRVLLGSTASRVLRKSRCPVLVVKEPARYGYERMLVAVDFPSASLPALCAARSLAPRAGIVLLNVVYVPFEDKLRYADVDENTISHFRQQACECATAQLSELAKAAGLTAVQYTSRVVLGNAARQILTAEEVHDCDLIVVGKHGSHVAEELLLGSVTKHVLAESRADVLVVSNKPAPGV